MAARFSLLRAAGWSVTWALGTALGVAAGAYLTVSDAAAATGSVTLSSTELLVLPVIGGVAVFVVSFVGRVVFAAGSAVLRPKHRDG